jgi:membrane protease YdiL (CAAX protease family)
MAVRSSAAYVLILGVVVLFLAVQIIVGLLAALLLVSTGTDPDSLDATFSNPYILLAVGVAIDAVLVAVLYAVYRYFKLDFWKKIALDKLPSKKAISTAAASYSLYFIAFGAIWAFVQQFVPAIDTEQTQNLGFESLQGLEYVATFIALVVLPPLVEEILFRGVLFRRLKHYMRTRTAAIITSVIFSAAHLELLGSGSPNLIAALDTFILSLFLIFALEESKSLWAPIIVHALKNALAFTVVFVL